MFSHIMQALYCRHWGLFTSFFKALKFHFQELQLIIHVLFLLLFQNILFAAWYGVFRLDSISSLCHGSSLTDLFLVNFILLNFLFIWHSLNFFFENLLHVYNTFRLPSLLNLYFHLPHQNLPFSLQALLYIHNLLFHLATY